MAVGSKGYWEAESDANFSWNALQLVEGFFFFLFYHFYDFIISDFNMFFLFISFIYTETAHWKKGEKMKILVDPSDSDLVSEF